MGQEHAELTRANSINFFSSGESQLYITNLQFLLHLRSDRLVL